MANELARHGAAVRIVDRAPAPPVTPRALVVMPRSLEIFDDLGVIDDAIAADNPATAVTITFKTKKVRVDIAGVLPTRGW
jgi:2-polyprenyl-6-methoxyphenol hydroxylase-like FAD-dependent oxidoreductase